MSTTRRTRGGVLAILALVVGGLAAGTSGCMDGDARDRQAQTAQSCMKCHNGSSRNDYAGPGIKDPHPFPNAAGMLCTTCHGGNPNGKDKAGSHVPPPPEIGDRAFQEQNRFAFFNRLTLTGLDKLGDYTVDGATYTALDYLRFINPGDLRVVTKGVSCGQCHQNHVDCTNKSLLATEAGVLAGALYGIGAPSKVADSDGRYEDTAADMGFRAVSDPSFSFDVTRTGEVSELIEFPVYSVRGDTAGIFRNNDYLSVNLADDVQSDGRVVDDSPLAHLYHEQVAFTCGDCHLGSAGANNRYGDFRSSGCTACHMPYSQSGRSGSTDPNIDKNEPLDVDDIEPGERPHLRQHRMVSVHRTLANGVQIEGMDDYTCAGCHQGSNRTVMQYWGIRLDQNQDLRRKVQYPQDPVSFKNTNNDTRLFDPVIRNRTFNGRNANQYILLEDYDGDGRDDTPPDVHYEAGLGCIDCHGSFDLHGGDVNTANNPIHSRMEHATSIACTDCHGTAAAYAATVSGTDYGGTQRDLAVDSGGRALRHVYRDSGGHYWMKSRLTGEIHYVVQTKDVVVANGRRHPTTGNLLYSAKASYAMGRADGDPSTGTGPTQTGGVTNGFSHGDTMTCESCHSSWTNTCMGCHLWGEYDEGNNFSNITGERIVFEEDEALFVYQSPLFFTLGVGPENKIEDMSSNTKMFFQWEDRQNVISKRFTFSDRNGRGANTSAITYPSLAHNAMMAHSIRGRVNDQNEGPRYCVACHMTDTGIATYGTAYDTFRTAMATDDFAALDFGELRDHFGRNTGNTKNSPFFVHMVAGLGSGLFLFDENGIPVNPLDDDDRRQGANDVSPADRFNLANVRYNLDRIVLPNGTPTGSNNHALAGNVTSSLRDGAPNPKMAGPLGATLIRKLTDPSLGVVLDSWIDPDGALQGDASTHVK